METDIAKAILERRMKGFSPCLKFLMEFFEELQGANGKQGTQNIGFNLLTNRVLNTHGLQLCQLQVRVEREEKFTPQFAVNVTL